MSRIQVVILAVALLALSLLNTYVIHAYGRARELYPMSAFQMFSGPPKEFTRKYVFMVTARPGETPVELPGEALLRGKAGSSARRIIHAMAKSSVYGCPDYRLRGYRYCNEQVERWRVPADLAGTMVTRAQAALKLDQPPVAITLVKVQTPVSTQAAEVFGGATRRDGIFTWRPASGDRVEPIMEQWD